MWCRDSDEAMDAGYPAQALYVIASNETAHAEADEVNWLRGGKYELDVGLDLASEDVEPGLAVVGNEIECVDFPATFFQMFPQALEDARRIAEPVK